MITTYRYTGWVNLCETGITEVCPFFMGLPGRRHITAHGVCTQVEHISVATAADQYGMTEMPFEFSVDKVTCNNTSCFAINHHYFQHFMPGIHGHIAQCYLAFERLVSSDQQL